MNNNGGIVNRLRNAVPMGIVVFTAVMVYGYIRGHDIVRVLEFATVMAVTVILSKAIWQLWRQRSRSSGTHPADREL